MAQNMREYPITSHGFATLLLCRDTNIDAPLPLHQNNSIVSLHRRRLVNFRAWCRQRGTGGYYITPAGLRELGHGSEACA